MLILTDRANDGLRIHERLKRYRECHVVALHQALTKPSTRSVIVCDLQLSNETSVKLLRAALARHRLTPEMPVLFLTRDSSHLTTALAMSLGATELMPCNAPPAEVVATAERLIAAYESRNRGARRVVDPTEARAADAKAALSACFDAVKRREAVSIAALESGASVVLGAIKQAKIRAWLDVVWRFDDVTYQHCLLVAGLSAAFAMKLGLAPPHQHLLSQAALIHDVGKARIPSSILNKPAALSKPEIEVMRTHAALGHGMLVGQPGVHPAILDVTRHHHEYLDGSGYPDRLQGAQISGYVRIVTICDIYAALIERRPYKAPMQSQQALAVLADMAPKLDGGLLKSFQAVVTEAG